MATVDELKVLLSQAEAAHHELLTGDRVVQITDADGQSLNYNGAFASDKNALAQYIAQLKAQIYKLGDTTVGVRRRALRTVF